MGEPTTWCAGCREPVHARFLQRGAQGVICAECAQNLSTAKGDRWPLGTSVVLSDSDTEIEQE